MSLRLTFWGTRGSIPSPGPHTVRYGGNTPCVEVRTGDGHLLILDAGTGIRALGRSLVEQAEGASIEADLFLTHAHWDHIQGIPFFAPLYSPANQVTFHSSKAPEDMREILEGQMSNPYFPVRFDLLAARREFVQITGHPLKDNRLSVHAFPLNHPQGATGFRLEFDGAVVVHACDHEHGIPEID
ncbi:MAG: MBL fold metallo-hydrolase, partial [Gemmatimonadota bacterium]